VIKVIAKSLIQENSLDEVIKLYEELVYKTRLEDGCISYELFEDIDDKNVLVIVEQWESEKHLEAHKLTEHFTKIVPQISTMRLKSEINILNKIL